MAEPYPKSRQLARGERRYRRRVASAKQWQAIIAEKGSVCRLADKVGDHGLQYLPVCTRGVEYHHLVGRDGLGDDVAANIVPLCHRHHEGVTYRFPWWLRLLAESLSDAEYAYVVGKLGEDGPRRLFGV